MSKFRNKLCVSLVSLAVFSGCEDTTHGSGTGVFQGGVGGNVGSGPSTSSGLGGADPTPTALDDRRIDYNEALRTASLKVLRELPDLMTIRRVQNSSDTRAEYEMIVDEMLEDPRFKSRMVKFWRDVMRQGGTTALDHSPILAARISVEGQPFTDVFTATVNTCPTYVDGEFIDGECNNGVPVHAGVLTNPGSMSHFYGNMAFRRVRWVQEIFMCQKFPAEVVADPTVLDGKDYVSPWKFESVSTEPINFQDTQSVVCANCHTTMNHLAPLFSVFDFNGMWTGNSEVNTPTLPDPVKTELSHWLSSGEKTSWRFGIETPDLPALGAALADDPGVSDCVTTRLWNLVMSKEDVITDLAVIPPDVLDPLVVQFNSTGMSVKETLRFMLKHDDFVNF